MGSFFAALIDSTLIHASRKFTGRWGWRGFALSLGLLLAIWLVLLMTR